MESAHLFKTHQVKPHNATKGGFRVKATKKNFPLLQGMSLYHLVLHARGVREPHWHPNADELGYCLKGEVLVSFYGNRDLKEAFLVRQGEIFLIPSGYLHSIEDVSGQGSELILQFSHEEPEEFALSSSLGMFSNAVLGNTWGISQDDFKELKRSTAAVFATINKSPVFIPESARYASSYRFDLEGSQPVLIKEGGMAKMAKHSTWPVVRRQSLYSLSLTKTGMREPHWHPETAELGFVDKGKGRMSIMNPEGSIETYEMHPGDVYFIPKAYPHHIENLEESLHLLIFFDQAMPGDIGFTGSVRSFSNETLGSTMNIAPSFFDRLKKYYVDQFIVNKLNPLD